MRTEEIEALLAKASAGCWQRINDDFTIASGSFEKIGRAENPHDAELMSMARSFAVDVLNLRDEIDSLQEDKECLVTQVSDLKAELQLLKQSKLAVKVAQLREAQRWIPVSERLPDRDSVHDVIVRSTDNPTFQRRAVAVPFLNGEFSVTKHASCEYVSHWKALPEMPEFTAGDQQ